MKKKITRISRHGIKGFAFTLQWISEPFRRASNCNCSSRSSFKSFVTCGGGPLKVMPLQGKSAEDTGPTKEENSDTNSKKSIVSYNLF